MLIVLKVKLKLSIRKGDGEAHTLQSVFVSHAVVLFYPVLVQNINLETRDVCLYRMLSKVNQSFPDQTVFLGNHQHDLIPFHLF